MRQEPPPLVRLVLALFVVWGGVALAHETGDVLAGWDARQANREPCVWRFGMAPVERLERCLAGVEGWVPRDSVVIFASPAGPCSAEFYRWRWAAYLLPDLLVSSPGDHDGRQRAEYVIAYRMLPEPPPGASLELLRPLVGGHLYRIHRP